MTTNLTTNFPIDRVLAAFEKGDVPTLLGSVADDLDFRIDHYRDDADTSWQVARNQADLLTVLQRLGTEIFPQGTQIVHTHSQPLGDDWVMTQLSQRFFYGVQKREVESLTWILSHSQNGQLDYFRETVTTITPT
ncbi:MAG: hypothetical protein ABS37_08035 [Acidovorax sp. SCN 65-108]|nr:MAG: hypothetical protein ABS37_08035 [Acidovorax sp. SCN 65-108]OJV69172.1 MAG: hypothetical protein BGO35_15540 [Burkholderiales bacterium 64-34]